MLIHGTQLNPVLMRDADAVDRFWYWRGFSGRSYIHSVYAVDSCPPVPGAVYVLVQRKGPLRIALKAGRLPNVWSAVMGAVRDWAGADADEVHVHLLARDSDDADRVAADLVAALRGEAGIPARALAA